MAGKTFVPQYIRFVRILCKYYTLHLAKVLAALSPVLTAPDLALVTTAMSSLKIACDILEENANSF